LFGFIRSRIPERDNTLEEASTDDSAKTHAGNVFVTHDLDLLMTK